jgi:hypothetical protein
MNSNIYIPLMGRATVRALGLHSKKYFKKVAANGTFPELRVYILS